MTEDEDTPDPIEDAWLDQDFATLERLAQARVAANPNDGSAHAWLGVAWCHAGRRRDGFAEVKRAFDLVRAKASAAKDEEEKADLLWELHALGNRLLSVLGDDEGAAIEGAHFIVETLAHEHPASLRWLAHDLAGTDPVKAAALLKRALAVEPTDPESHYLAARVMARMGRKPQVLSELKKAIEHAEGTIAVRALARVEPDFGGFRSDPEFLALIELLPTSEPLRALYVALDAGEFTKVVSLAAAAKPKVANALDVLYPWREALEQLLDQGDTAREAELDALQQEIEAHEDRDEESPVYARFCGDA